MKAEDYIRHLKLSDGKLILNSNWRTGFQGLIVCIQSLMNLYDNLIECPGQKLKYLLTYKMIQDHIELFFGGWGGGW